MRFAPLAMSLIVAAVPACVSGAGGDEDAFCRRVRSDAPDVLEADAPEAIAPSARSALADMTAIVPEALVDDVEVLAKSDDGVELREAFRAVRAYATAVCPVEDP